MYNRYTPQADGTHRKRTLCDCASPQPKPLQPAAPPPPLPVPPCSTPSPRTPCASRQGGSATGFLSGLLPNDFDTGDLLIVLLLLLMAGDCKEDRNWAWLTLALYLIL